MKKEEQKDLLIGEEIAIRQIGVPYGWLYRRTEPGYLLADGTALLECERDSAGRYKGGAGLDGVYLHTGRLYVPVLAEDGKVRAFQEVRPGSGHAQSARQWRDWSFMAFIRVGLFILSERRI